MQVSAIKKTNLAGFCGMRLWRIWQHVDIASLTLIGGKLSKLPLW
jgi:hypothetical protein